MRGKHLVLRVAVILALLGVAVVPSCKNRNRSMHEGFVGRQTCAQCHAAQAKSYRNSQHDAAMQEPSEATVLGDFSSPFEADGVRWEFSKQPAGYFVETVGRDGEKHEYRVKYTFGIEPLQQYLVEEPGGRLQSLRVCWDSRSKTEGGQRWFHLYPGEQISHFDELHWTGRNQTWNFMCAECHSTDLHKNYSAEQAVYHTSFAEIDVSCESCHGPGAGHVAWAQNGGGSADPKKGLRVSLKRATDIDWTIDPATGSAKGSETPRLDMQTETCARCHSRRTRLTDDYQHGHPILDSHRLELLTRGLYHPDGQILDEVYVYGSFAQSKMYQRGVTCSDCHEPHSTRLLAQGNALCARCHDPQRFDVPSHHHHKPGSSGSLCVECHMPTRSYMVIDPRRDHSLRVPRPDLAERLGTPDACTACHEDQSSAWAAKQVATWFGEKRRREFHFGEALSAMRSGTFGAAEQLARLLGDSTQPAIARATALAESAPFLDEIGIDRVKAGLRDPDPLMRMGALRSFDAFDGPTRLQLGSLLLRDPVRSVRLEALNQLAVVKAEDMPERVRSDFDLVTQEFMEVQAHNADRPYAHVNRGLFYHRQGRLKESETAYLAALTLEPGSIPATANLADLYREWDRDDRGETLLREALVRIPGSAEIHHALGLLLVRKKQHGDSLPLLKKAADLGPENPHLSYVYGFALTSLRQVDEGLRVWTAAQTRHPNDRELLHALATTHFSKGDLTSARRYAKRLVDLAPRHQGFQALWSEISKPR
ncbi:MAG: tetratricopeptide repeat protein [Planctomycetota bacterium]|nr:tetratricopeptide repeat protein [Planctomycetota bacterium]